MNTQEKLNHIYKLYSEKKYSEAFLLVQEILKIEPQNIYAKRYVDLLKHYLNDKSEVWKIATVKGKNLKCPHCISSISLSALNEEQKTKIRENNYSNLEIKCPYCHTKFVLQKKTENSIIWINIWDKISYKWKKFRVVWSVKYIWTWEEWYYHWKLNYLEWILLGEDNSYIYFSEWYFIDDWEKNYEFEFSEKIIPDFSIKFENNLVIFINWKKIDIKELNRVNVSSIYWENSKVFQVWEEITLYNFSYLWQDYILEKESVWRQSEAWVYFSENVSRKKACEIFWKEYKINFDFSKLKFDLEKIIYTILFIIFFWVPIISFFINLLWVFLFSFIVFCLILYWIYFLNKEILKSKNFQFFIIWPFFALLSFLFFSNFFEFKKEISLQNISEWKKFEIVFENPDLKEIQEIWKKRYDYWWIETTFKEKTWLSFSVKSDEDKKIIEKIKNKDWISEELKNIFSEKIYKIR